MKAFKVDMDGVEEVDMPEGFVCSTAFDWDWDCVRLGDGHVAWVRDDALFQPDVSVATIGEGRDVPLPAYVLGVHGERTVAATMSLDSLSGRISRRRRIR